MRRLLVFVFCMLAILLSVASVPAAVPPPPAPTFRPTDRLELRVWVQGQQNIMWDITLVQRYGCTSTTHGEGSQSLDFKSDPHVYSLLANRRQRAATFPPEAPGVPPSPTSLGLVDLEWFSVHGHLNTTISGSVCPTFTQTAPETGCMKTYKGTARLLLQWGDPTETPPDGIGFDFFYESATVPPGCPFLFGADGGLYPFSPHQGLHVVTFSKIPLTEILKLRPGQQVVLKGAKRLSPGTICGKASAPGVTCTDFHEIEWAVHVQLVSHK